MKLKCDIKCPKCARSFKQAVGEMRPGRSRSCPHCGVTIRWTGDDGGKAQRTLDEFKRDMKKISKQM